MRYEEGADRRRLWLPGIAIGAAIAVAGLAVLIDHPESMPNEDPVAAGDGRSPGAGPTQSVITTSPSADPVVTAENWLRSYRTIDYRDPSPTSWALRVAPLLDEPARSQVAQQAAVATGGASWERFTSDRCESHVSGVGAVVPPEAPRTTTAVYVQVTGTVITSCAAGGADQPDEPFSATLELRRDPGAERWRVARRLY